ncbi:MAG: S24 family peptidase [Peptococcaceae bacterium]|nr:S24 family peptidase [Peptococcaceae bacterium]
MAFDKKKFALLLARAKGERSINSYGNQAKVDPGYISRLLRQKIETPPGPGVIRKLADHAMPGVTYEELMAAAGHIREPAEHGIYSLKAALEQKVAEALQKPLAEFLPVRSVPLVDPSKRDLAGHKNGVVAYINVPRELDADFAFTVKDDAMIDAGIFPGDVAVCRKTGRASQGDMVVVRFEGGHIGIRYLLEKGGCLRLKPANVLIPEEKEGLSEVLGVVLMIQKKALTYKQFTALRERENGEETISEDFLLEKLAERSGVPLARLRQAVRALKPKTPL